MSQDVRYGRGVDAPSMLGPARHLGGNSMSEVSAPPVDGELGRIAAQVDYNVAAVAALSNRAHSLAARLMGEQVLGTKESNALARDSSPGDLGRVYDRLASLETHISGLAVAISRLEQL